MAFLPVGSPDFLEFELVFDPSVTEAGIGECSTVGTELGGEPGTAEVRRTAATGDCSRTAA